MASFDEAAPSNIFIPLADLPQAFDGQIRFMEGSQHSAFATSVLISNVPPGAGPPLHLHYTEEVQVLPTCRVEFLIGDRRYTIEGPGVAIVPASTPHTFVNLGDESVHIISFFPTSLYEANSKDLGPNPLLK